MTAKTSPILIYTLFVILTGGRLLSASDPTLGPARLVTALDHLSVLEFDEPVSQVAVGSSEFHVEYEGNKVFIKPLEKGVSTNLLIWTASQQNFDYELSVGEAPTMNSRIHNAVAKPVLVVDQSAELERIADHVISHTLVGRQNIDSKKIKTSSNGIGLRVEGLFRSKRTVYVQYSVENLTSHPYRIPSPTLAQLQPDHPQVNPLQLKGKQLDRTLIRELGTTSQVSLPVAHADATVQEVLPNSRIQGVVAFRLTSDNVSPTILRIALDSKVQATMVF